MPEQSYPYGLNPADFGPDGITLYHLIGIALNDPARIVERRKVRGNRDEPKGSWQLSALIKVLADRGIDVHKPVPAPDPAPADDDRPESDKRWNEALDWLLNSRHTADPDIQGPFWAYVDGKITREELKTFSWKDVDEREKKLAVTFVDAARCGGSMASDQADRAGEPYSPEVRDA